MITRVYHLEIHMIKAQTINDISEKISQMIPSQLHNIQGDLKNNIKALLQSHFAQLDLVTREEFDIQCAVLARTRQQLAILEQKISQLEYE